MRTITAAAQSAVAGEHVWFVVFIELAFDSGTVRLCSAGHDMQWGGYTWQGGARFCSMEPVEETASPVASALGLRLSGIEPGYISRILSEHYQGRPARIWFAPLSEQLVTISDPVPLFVGRMDEPEVSLGDSADIVLRLESRWADWDRPRVRRLNSADQQTRWPNDRFFEYAESMDGLDFIWGTLRGPDPPKKPNNIVAKAVNVISNIGSKIGDFFGW